jgi:hypothetical protein
VKLTNKFNIPQTFVNVLERPTYTKGKAHLSVTQLINSPKIVALTQKFDADLEQDVSDMVWSIFGTAIHGVLEHGKDENHIVEERLHATLDGWRISGAIDLQIKDDAGLSIRDYKTTSAWGVMNEKVEWEQQLNTYAWLVETVKKTPIIDIGIVAIIRDWSRRDAAKNENYPPAPVKEIPIRLWTYEEQTTYIKHRIGLHSACEFAMETEEDLPPCTPDEMWERPTVWALKKSWWGQGQVFVHEDRGRGHAQSPGDCLAQDYEIEVRPGSRIRCESFCPVNTYCQQWRGYQESFNEN